MKTPMQELLNYTTDLLHTFDSEQRVAMAVLDYLKTNKKALLEKEKEVMCNFTADYTTLWEFQPLCGQVISIQDYYNETFKTKER